jgi:flagellar hook assembly protein FlgD
MLQRAVVSNGGGAATNGTTNGMFIVGQAATGTASNAQMIGHFGFFALGTAASSVIGSGAGAISSLHISPNPASNDVIVNVTLANAGNVDLLLYDESGHLVSTLFSGRKEAGINTFHVDGKSLASGAYFVAVQVPGALVQSKLDVVK